jgi:pimeloyl-ACP methyl ester carboxylesterase
VLWGDSDRIVDVDYGRAYAAAISSARFWVLAHTGHLPQIETPDQLIDAIQCDQLPFWKEAAATSH